MRWLDDGRQDLRYAVRGLARAPGFAVVAILSLTLGIGANALIFTLVKALIWPSLPVRNPSDLVVIYSTTRNRTGDVTPFQSTSYLNSRDYLERNEVCSGLQNLGEPPQPIVYFPLRQHYSPQMTVYVKTKGWPSESVNALPRGDSIPRFERRTASRPGR